MSKWKYSRRSRNNPQSSDEAERPILSSNQDRNSNGKKSSLFHSHKDKRESEAPSKTLDEVFDESYWGDYKPLYSSVFAKFLELQNVADIERETLNDLEEGCKLLPYEDDIWEYKGYCSELKRVRSRLQKPRENNSHGIEELEVEERFAKEDKEGHEQSIDYNLEQLRHTFNLHSNVAKDANTSAQSLSSKSQVIEDYEYLLEFWEKRDLENLAKSIDFLEQARNNQRKIFDNDYWENRYNKFIQELSSKITKLDKTVEDLRWSEKSEGSVEALKDAQQKLRIIKGKIDTELALMAKLFGLYTRNKEVALKNVQSLWKNEQVKKGLENLKLENKSHIESKREHSKHKSTGHKLKR